MDIRKLALGVATFAGGVVAVAVGAVALARRGSPAANATPQPQPQPLLTDAIDAPAPAREQLRDVAPVGDEGHSAPDLVADATPGERAPVAFRPDMDAPMTAAEREALRPATGASPTLVDAGTSLPG